MPRYQTTYTYRRETPEPANPIILILGGAVILFAVYLGIRDCYKDCRGNKDAIEKHEENQQKIALAMATNRKLVKQLTWTPGKGYGGASNV